MANPLYRRTAASCTSHWQLPEAVTGFCHGTCTWAATKPMFGVDVFRFSESRHGSAPP